MIHNHEVRGSIPRLATDIQIVSFSYFRLNPSPSYSGEGYYFSKDLISRNVTSSIA